jgi:hypothetical protein
MVTQMNPPRFGNIPPRDKGFLERTLDDIQEMDLKQILSIPLTGSLNTAAGALQGLTSTIRAEHSRGASRRICCIRRGFEGR